MHDWKKAVLVWNSSYAKGNEIENFYKVCSLVELVDWCWLTNFIAWGASHLLPLHIKKLPQTIIYNLTNKIARPECRCTNKESAWSEIGQHQSESASHAPSPSKQLITWTQILEKCSRVLWYGCGLWFS